MANSKTDPTIEQIEAELNESRFKAWDVETFLANRHQAKINALTAPDKGRWRPLFQAVKEIGFMLFAFVGYLAVMTLAGGWLLTGEFPLSQQALAKYRACQINPALDDAPPPLYPSNPPAPR